MKLSDMEKAATPAPWQVWDSCSWRRVCTVRGEGVIVPTNSPSDGHPDLDAKRDDLDLAVAARNALRPMLVLLREAKCPNRGKYVGQCVDGVIASYKGPEPCKWCAKRAEILEGE